MFCEEGQEQVEREEEKRNAFFSLCPEFDWSNFEGVPI